MDTIDAPSFHKNLANYFVKKPLYLDEPTQKKPNTRKLVEQPWQHTKAEMWDDITDTLCNLDFIQAKAVAKMTYELVRDLNDVLEVIPDNQENIHKEKAHQARMDKYTKDLIACANGEIPIEKLEIPESTTLWSVEQTSAEIEKIKTYPSRVDILNDFKNFLGQEANHLQSYAHKYSHFAIQQAWNFTNDGPLGNRAGNMTLPDNKLLLQRTSLNRPPWNPLPGAIKILKGHSKKINAITITPDGRYAISGSEDNKCILWDLVSGKALQTLKGHTDSVKAVAITPDAKWAISGSTDKTCILWDLRSGEAIQTLRAHTESVEAITITADGKRAVSGSIDKTCILWDLNSGESIKILHGHKGQVKNVSITPDGKQVFSWCSSHDFIIWDLESGEPKKSFQVDYRGLLTASITHDGNHAIGFFFDLVTDTETLGIVDIYTGKPILTKILNDIDIDITSLSYTNDLKMAIYGTKEKTCVLWDLTSGETIKTLYGHSDEVTAVSITPDGRLAISGSQDGICILWNLHTGISLKTSNGHIGDIIDISISPDGNKAISGSDDKTCILWDLSKASAIKTLKGYPGKVNSVLITSNGKFAIAGGENNNLGVFEFGSKVGRKKLYNWRETIADQEKTNSETFDSEENISKSKERFCLVWDLDSCSPAYILFGHDDTIKILSITPDGNHLISVSRDKSCILWDLQNVAALKKIFTEYDARFNSVSITPDGKYAITNCEDRESILWDLNTGNFKKIFNLENLFPDYDETITIDEYYALMDEHNVLSSEKYSVSISPDGKLAFFGTWGGGCILWNLTTNKQISILKGHSSHVLSVAISPDGKLALSGSMDNTCVLWDLKTSSELARFCTNSSIRTVKFYSHGFILAGSELFVLKEINCCNPVTTIRQIWDLKLEQYQPFTADCPLCGHRFYPSQKVLDTIEEIKLKTPISLGQSPCLELPDEAWQNPGLKSNCPTCNGKIKFNPFLVIDHEIEKVEYLRWERENEDKKNDEIYLNAEKSFKTGNWQVALGLYSKLAQVERFDANYIKFNMALCQINTLLDFDQNQLDSINYLISFLEENGEIEQAQILQSKLSKKLNKIKNENKPLWIQIKDYSKLILPKFKMSSIAIAFIVSSYLLLKISLWFLFMSIPFFIIGLMLILILYVKKINVIYLNFIKKKLNIEYVQCPKCQKMHAVNKEESKFICKKCQYEFIINK